MYRADGPHSRGQPLLSLNIMATKANIATIEPNAAGGNCLVIRLPVHNPPSLSKSGKSLVVSSTYGNCTTEVQVNGKPLIVGVNAFIPI